MYNRRAKDAKYYTKITKEKRRSYNLARTLKLRGLTKEQYDELYLKQVGLCALCHEPFGDETPTHRSLSQDK